MPHPAPVTRIGHLLQALCQAGALASQRCAVTGRQVPKLLQGMTDQGQ